MKSNRQAALSKGAVVKSRNVSMPKEAIKVLINLERARNYGSKRKYNAELNKLAKNHPEFSESILALRWN